MNAKKTIKGMHAAQQTMYRANFSLGEQIDALQAEVEALRAALRDLLTAVTYSTPPKEYGTPDDPNPCYEARVPVAFVDEARAALKGKDQ